jgi:acetyl esterase/lipase
MTPTETKWAARVQEWRAGDKTAEEFAAGQAYQPSTLKFWASKLKSSASSAPAPTVPIARVVRRRGRPEGAGAIEVILGGARVVVRHGFDAVLLREIAAALGCIR